ncbi:MAG: hypothetical protein J5756_03260 [Clostridia bacterium]|nr:hypothetical protein [Clostridia bacterium]MBR5768756.1 hypothetical protein [Clostridia bacterium]
MEFFSDTGEVLMNVLRSALYGAAAGLALEVVNGWNAAVRPNKKALFAADLGWCLCAALGFFMLLLKFADGELRLIWFAGAAAGYFAYRRVAGRAAKRAFKACFRFFARVRKRIRERVLRPAGAAAKKILIFLSKPLIFFARCIKMAIYWVKSGKIKRRIARRKRKWLREREKAQREKVRCSE